VLVTSGVKNEKMRLVIAMVAVFMPQRLKHACYTRLLGWEIDPTARIGLTLLHARHVRIADGVWIRHFNAVKVAGTFEMGSYACIGMFNVFHGCELIRMGTYAGVSHGNRVSGPPLSKPVHPRYPDRKPHFELGAYSLLLAFHRIECIDEVKIGDFTVIGGGNSEILTHGVDVAENVMRVGKVEIGDYCYLGTKVLVQMDSRIPDRSVVAPCAVVHGDLPGQEQLYGGVPARPLKSVAGGKFFKRTADAPWLE
jgi:acetyltransferase-like isoleucine patch superfamily enzyme